jgi:hypothetical protein
MGARIASGWSSGVEPAAGSMWERVGSVTDGDDP